MFPPIVSDYILDRTLNQRAVAYLKLSREGALLESGGLLLAYGLDNLKIGSPVSKVAVFLEGLLPLQRDTLLLPNVQTNSGVVADLHLFRQENSDWVILMEATRHVLEKAPIQQQSNEYALVREQQARYFEQQLGRDTGEDLQNRFGENSDLVLMIIRINNLSSYAASKGTSAAFAGYSQLLEETLPEIRSRNGSIEKISEHTMRILFDAGEAKHGTIADHVIDTAQHLHGFIADRCFGGSTLTRDRFEVSISVVAGPIETGVINICQRKMFGIMGEKVDEATALSQQADSGEIVIDETIFAGLKRFASKFQKQDGHFCWVVQKKHQ